MEIVLQVPDFESQLFLQLHFSGNEFPVFISMKHRLKTKQRMYKINNTPSSVIVIHLLVKEQEEICYGY